MEIGLRCRGAWDAPRVVAVALAMIAALLLAVAPSEADAATAPADSEGDATVQWEATINGRPIDGIDANDPLRLDPAEGALIELTLTNDSAEEVAIRSVRLDGTVMGLTMYNFTTRVDVLMPPDSVTTRTFEIDLIDLSGQATGLIPSRLQLLDADREVVQEAGFPADIRGSVNSVYGVFGLAVLGITLLMLGGLLLAIRRTEMPENRWKRALRFLPVGLGLGFVLTFTLSATRQLSPSAASWTTVVLACSAAAFAIGYFLPVGVADDESPDDAVDTADGDIDDDTDALDPVEADLATAGGVTGASATSQSSGHYWASGTQGQSDLDPADATDQDW